MAKFRGRSDADFNEFADLLHLRIITLIKDKLDLINIDNPWSCL